MTRIPDPSTHRHDQAEAAELRRSLPDAGVMITGQIMHQQYPINTSRPLSVDPSHQISNLLVVIRRFAWMHWIFSLAIAGFALLLVLDDASLPFDAMRLPFPPLLHLTLLLIPLLLLPQRATVGPLSIVMTAVGIELLATLITIDLQTSFAIFTDRPMPSLIQLYEYRHGVVAGAALLVLIIAFAVAWTSYLCRDDRHVTIIFFFLLLGLYGLARVLTGFCYGVPLEQPLLVWSIAAAVPAGLALGLLTACLVNRFRPHPESLPQAPQP